MARYILSPIIPLCYCIFMVLESRGAETYLFPLRSLVMSPSSQILQEVGEGLS